MSAKSMAAILGLVIAYGSVISAAGCGRKEQARAPMSRYLAKTEAPAPTEADESGSVADKAAGTAITERKLIARVTLTLEVEDLKDRVSRAEAIAKEFGGYLSDSQIYQEEVSQRASLTLMIPFNNLDQAVSKIRELGKVRFEQKSTEDVTRQFIDSQARINNLKKEEDALAALLNRTGKLSDILEVEQELARVRTEIDQIQGELRYLEHQTTYSTVTLSLSTKPEPIQYEGSPLKNAFFNAWHSFRAAIHGLAVFAIYALFFVPLILILFLFAYYLLRFIIRRVRKSAKSG